MKIYTDRGNTNALKLILAGVLSGKDLEIVEKKSDEKVASFFSRPKFPVLEDAEEQIYFCPNAAARFLLGTADDPELASVTDEWLEWEATQLQPMVQAVCIGYAQQGKAAGTLVTSLQALLSYLDQTTTNNPQHLVGPTVSIVDVVVWCGVYPLFTEDSIVKDLTSAYPHVRDWFNNFQQVAAVAAAQKKLPGGSTWDSLKTCLLSHPPTPLPSAGLARAPRHQASTDSTKSASVTSETDNAVTLPTVTPEEVKAATAAWNAGKAALSLPTERKTPIVPVDGERNILITSALPYVNNVPHLGNIIGCVLSADVFARFCRLRNLNTLYICGTDEYGTATETKAIEEGLTPQQICDKYNKLHSDIYQWFNIGFDYFGRTTTKQQTQIAQDIFWKLYNRNYILKDTLDQLQCVQCNRFLADRFVEGTCPFCAYEDARGDQCDKCGKLINAIELIQPRCKQCQSTPVVRTSQHLFMDLPKLQPLLDQHLDENFEKGIFTSNTKVITKSWIRDGLKPRCISRDLKWGTPVPLEGYTDKVFYVWYDAPIGYISITANYTDQWEKWWKNPQQVELFNFMAKDNVPFHSVIFPSSLLGTGDSWTVVNNLSATEYLNYEDGKFSKSRGVGVFGNDAKDTGIPADVWRFYLLFLRPESQDSTFSWDDFVIKNNSELLNNLGNFINRVLMFVSNNFAGVIPQMSLLTEDLELVALINRELRVFLDNLQNIKLRDGLRNILTISRYGNQYIQANKPWVKVKGTDEEKARAGTILGLAANVVCLLSVMMQPYIPAVSQTVQSQLNAPASCNVLHDVFVAHLQPGHKIGKPHPLFQKIEANLIADLKARFAGKQQSKESGTSSPASTPKASPRDVVRLTEAVVAQGDVVRKLKTEKAEKNKIDEQVKKLLDLKKQLTAAQGTPTPSSGGAASKKNSKQKDKTKGGKAEETAAQPASKDISTPTPTGDPLEIETLTKRVATQGETVRQLKSQKGDKATVDKAVASLLESKRQLAMAKGLDPEALLGGGASKKKGKKK